MRAPSQEDIARRPRAAAGSEQGRSTDVGHKRGRVRELVSRRWPSNLAAPCTATERGAPVDHDWTRLPDGTRLAHQVQGPAGAPVLLLLQGQANSHSWWEPVRPGLSRTLRTVTFDYRGTGATQIAARQVGAAPDGEWSTTSFASDAVAVLDGLGCQQAHVYGTSMGGRVAQMLAVHHRHRLKRLVLACTSPGGPLALERSQAVRRALNQSGVALLE